MKISPGLLGGLIIAGGIAAAVAAELPEIRRYLAMRNM
jgi:hypothetical protein